MPSKKSNPNKKNSTPTKVGRDPNHKSTASRHQSAMNAYNIALAKIEDARKANRTFLSLSSLNLEVLPPEIGQLKSLTHLELRINKLTYLPETICELTSIQELYLSQNQLQSLPINFFNLTSLKRLSLESNNIANLPGSIYKLKLLTDLDVGSNNITDIPFELSACKSLLILNISKNHISNFPSCICELTSLIKLDISGNTISILPPEIADLQKLKILKLHNNQISELPDDFKKLKQLKTLTLSGNGDLKLPRELLGGDPDELSFSNYAENQLPDAKHILDYYYRIKEAQGRQLLNEFKLVLVGRGGTGKTTLVHRLVEGEFKEFNPTDGINICQWVLTVHGTKVRAHVWDFGGQEIMHGTHRFFMTQRALYLVLVTSREDRQQHDAEYWLSLVRSFGGDDAPVIVLLHKSDELKCDVNFANIRSKYGQSITFLETDAKRDSTMEELTRKIELLAADLPDLRAGWPQEWHQIKEDLPQAQEDWQSHEAFCAFCRDRGVTDQDDQESLARNLHSLGLMLAFREEIGLRELGVLKPQWATNAIYKMLNAPSISASNARFGIDDFSKILDEKSYPKQVHLFLLNLMVKFALCFPLNEDEKNPRKKVFIIPELLPANEPDLQKDFPPLECLHFAYSYEPVLPPGLLPRFIVETFRYRNPEHAWKTGVVLRDDNCQAWVRGDVEGRKITVMVSGPEGGRRAMLAVVRQEFLRIHHAYERLSVMEQVPIPGHPLVWVSYQKLLKAESSQPPRETIEVELGSGISDWSVQMLLDGVGRLQIKDGFTDPARNSIENATLSDEISVNPLKQIPQMTSFYNMKNNRNEETSPPALPHPRFNRLSWLLTSFAAGTLSTLITYIALSALQINLLGIEFYNAIFSIALGSFIFATVLKNNPNRLARNQLFFIIISWLLINATAASISGYIKHNKIDVLFRWDGGIAWSFNIAFISVIIVLGKLAINEADRDH